MTREETISILEESKRQNEIMRDNPSTFWTQYQMADGIKNAETRIEALDLALAALRGPTREQVEKMRGVWVFNDDLWEFQCRECHGGIGNIKKYHFCPHCMAPMTDEAVDMMLERWKEAIQGG